MSLKKNLVILTAVALVAGATWYWWPESGKKGGRRPGGPKGGLPQNPIESVVAIRDIEETVDAAGYVRPVLFSDVKAEVSGKIQKIHVKDGQVVKKGDILIELDPLLVKADEDEARRNVQLQALNLEKTTRDFKRAEALREKGFVSDRELQDSRTAFEVTKLQCDVAQSRFEKAQENVRKTVLIAPHEGTVSDSNNLVEGQVVIGAQSINSGTLLMRVSDVSILRVDVNLNEFAATRLSLDREATITFDSIPGLTKKGKVTFLAPFGTPDVKTPDLRVFPCQVSFAAGNGARPGISANLSVLVAREAGCVTIPVSAIFVEGNERIIYAKGESGEWERRPVKLGLSDAGYTQVKSGVQAGETVSLVRQAVQR
ncbi:MAG: efflux RND transporter periplasmic adaptor subunit [Verrucomicrobia bacterium]|nr:efflux RND transporter periplasmic adaptor subunit [Verrucomicrobiota bacterium]